MALKPDYAEAHLWRATALENMKRYVEAIQALEQVFKYKPDFRFARGLIQHYKMHVCDWEGLDAAVATIVAGIRRGEPVALPFSVLSLVDDAALHHETAKIWVQQELLPAHALPPIVARDTPAKLRIGYFSGDFYDHPVAVLTAQLFEIHDRSRFEITAFSLEPSPPGPMRQRLEKAFDRFIDVQDKSDREVALLARTLEIDIAVDLGGHTGRCRAPKILHTEPRRCRSLISATRVLGGRLYRLSDRRSDRHTARAHASLQREDRLSAPQLHAQRLDT